MHGVYVTLFQSSISHDHWLLADGKLPGRQGFLTQDFPLPVFSSAHKESSFPDALMHKVQIPMGHRLNPAPLYGLPTKSTQFTPVQSSIMIQLHFILGTMFLDLQNNTLMKSKEGHPHICAPSEVMNLL